MIELVVTIHSYISINDESSPASKRHDGTVPKVRKSESLRTAHVTRQHGHTTDNIHGGVFYREFSDI
jgi:hypothetical protein